MIHISTEFSSEFPSGRFRLQATGHAGYHPGDDIVCAGCSALVYALAGALRGLSGHVSELSVQLEPGDALISAQGDSSAAACFQMAETGLRQIAAAYPQWVSVTGKHQERSSL